MKHKRLLSIGMAVSLAAVTTTVWAAPPQMHIMEGFLPPVWAILWWVVALPFWVMGLRRVQTLLRDHPGQRMYLGLAGGFIFVLSALKIPSVTGSSSHPTGTGMSTLMFGPFVTAILGTIALIFQALLLAHGGISTLGANAVSMAIGAPLIAYYGVWKPLGGVPSHIRVFLTAFVADLAAYVITSTQLALAFPDPVSGFAGSWIKFATVFAITQVPLAIAEGLLTVLVVNALQTSTESDVLSANPS